MGKRTITLLVALLVAVCVWLEAQPEELSFNEWRQRHGVPLAPSIAVAEIESDVTVRLSEAEMIDWDGDGYATRERPVRFEIVILDPKIDPPAVGHAPTFDGRRVRLRIVFESEGARWQAEIPLRRQP